MKGLRKYRFALYALAALSAAFVGAAWLHVAADLFHEYVVGLALLVGLFGGTNGVEHVAEAIRDRKAGVPPAEGK